MLNLTPRVTFTTIVPSLFAEMSGSEEVDETETKGPSFNMILETASAADPVFALVSVTLICE